MRGHFFYLMVVFCLFSFTQAQNNETVVTADQPGYINIMAGFPFFQVHYGMEKFLGENGDLRLTINLSPFLGFGVGGGVDALFTLGKLDEYRLIYAGGGLGISSFFSDYSNFLGFELYGTLGYEQPITETISLMSESSFGLGYGANTSLDTNTYFLYPSFRSGIGLKFKL